MSKNEFESVEEAIEMLSEGAVYITFIKKTDGNVRTMHSTLDKSRIPYGEYDTVNSIVANSLKSDGNSPMVVWDLYNSGWRSFYMGSTIEIQKSLVFGDTTQMAEEMIQEKTIGEDITPEEVEGIITSIVGVIRGRIKEETTNIPEKLGTYTSGKIIEMVTNVVKSNLIGRGPRGKSKR
jgi:hypothetical protein